MTFPTASEKVEVNTERLKSFVETLSILAQVHAPKKIVL